MSTQPQHHRPTQDPPRGALSPDIREVLRAALEQAVPFNLHNAVRIREVAAGSGVAELPDAEHLKNHLGTQHGGALFAVAEAAAGAAYIGAFVEHLADIRMNAQEAHITYMRWAKGPITARSSLKRQPHEILQALQRRGRVELHMSCILYDRSGSVVAEMTFRFHLKQIKHTTNSTLQPDTVAPPSTPRPYPLHHGPAA